MKKAVSIAIILIAVGGVLAGFTHFDRTGAQTAANTTSRISVPQFYKGFYLNSLSGRNMDVLKRFIENAKTAGLNTVVIDAHNELNNNFLIPRENVQYVISQGLYPIARVVMFYDGLKIYPVPEELIAGRLELAKQACEAGFREIQFDYIRFNDQGILKHVTLEERYKTIEGFLARAKKELAPYNVRIACDIFGRIPLNNNDIIGQRIEGLDPIVDVICPMAYPSHYTWSKKMMADPYYTVYITGKRARERAKNADIVMYIQAFQIRIDISGLTYQQYIEKQIQAVHDAGVKGFIFWNAAQEYTYPKAVAKQFYADLNNQGFSNTVDTHTSAMRGNVQN